VLDTVTVSLPGVLDTLNPLLSRSPVVRSIAALVFPALVTTTADGQFAPSLATSWSAVGPSWTFHLDATRRWQDGVTVTSADVAYTLNLIQATNSPVDPQLHAAWQGVQVATPDTETVILTVPVSIGASILDLATTPILPAHLLAATPLQALQLAPFASHPVGSGAYRLLSANSLTAVLESTGHDDLQPRRLIIDTGQDGSIPAALPRLGVGGVRLLSDSSTASSVHTTRVPLSRPVFVFLNTHDPVLGNVAVRQALNLAVSRTQLVAGPLQGRGVALRTPLAPGLWEAAGTAALPTHDNVTAAHDLEASGWRLAAGATRRRDGQALAVTLLVDNDPARLAVAQAIARDWRAIGVRVSVETVGLDGLLRDFVLPGHYQAALIGTQQRGVEPDLADLWHTGGSLNITGWSDPVADAALDAIRADDLDSRRAGYRAFSQRFIDETPAIPLYLPSVRFAVQGLRLPASILNDPADVLRSAESWRPTP
jgi:peptide/nickel transport system substrate-binding protein